MRLSGIGCQAISRLIGTAVRYLACLVELVGDIAPARDRLVLLEWSVAVSGYTC